MKHIEITNELRERIAAVESACAAFTPGGDPGSVIEILKIELADAVLAAVARARQRVGRVAALPKASPIPVVEVAIRPKRRRTA